MSPGPASRTLRHALPAHGRQFSGHQCGLQNTWPLCEGLRQEAIDQRDFGQPAGGPPLVAVPIFLVSPGKAASMGGKNPRAEYVFGARVPRWGAACSLPATQESRSIFVTRLLKPGCCQEMGYHPQLSVPGTDTGSCPPSRSYSGEPNPCPMCSLPWAALVLTC